MNEKGDDLALNPVSEARGGFLSSNMDTSLSASDFVIRPHWGALIGMILADFRTC